jgi:hypothetical protein
MCYFLCKTSLFQFVLDISFVAKLCFATKFFLQVRTLYKFFGFEFYNFAKINHTIYSTEFISTKTFFK